jgi:DNA-binding HxlR family transcriptional regulator
MDQVTEPRGNPHDMNCPSRAVLELVGSKWSILLVCSLKGGPARTGELIRKVGGISQKMFTQTIRELELNGLVERTSYPEVPPRVDYRLTAKGQSLGLLVKAMEEWVAEHYESTLASRRARDA